MKNSPILSPLLILTFYSILAYLPLTPFLGFYSEDFFFSYVGHFYGLEGLIKSNAIDRPLDGYLMALGYSFLADNIFTWHILTFFLRLFGGVILFFTLKKIWPDKFLVTTSITLLFLIFPGFLQQTLPFGYLVYPLGLIFWISSLFFSIQVISSKNIFNIAGFLSLALIQQVFSFLNLEFFIGMEALRILIIVYILNKNSMEFLLKSIKSIFKFWRYWFIYILSLVIFVFWRIFLFNSTRDITSISWVAQTYYSDITWIFKIPLEIFFSFISTTIFAFFVPFMINFVRLPIKISVMLILIGIVSSSFLYIYLRNLQISKSDKNLGKQLFLIGIVSILFAVFPIIIAGRQIRMFNVLDRYTITSIISVGFILVGLALFKFQRGFKWFMALLIALSVTSHLMNSYWHKIMWDRQKDLWWQLYWRAPKIDDNSMLILNFPKLSEDSISNNLINKFEWQRFYWAEEQIWSAGNLFLNYNSPPEKHFHGDFLSDKGIPEKINKGESEIMNNRTIIYTRDFTKSIIIDSPTDISCLRVVEGENLINQEPTNPPPAQIFGKEPNRNWCYYFQKASLARQLRDWNQLATLKEEVINKNLKPQDPAEWVVFDIKLR